MSIFQSIFILIAIMLLLSTLFTERMPRRRSGD
jgi:hypothetical protein